ncbi:MAG: flagellar basal body P-ring protein FlgI [Phycisphaerae bacterium]|nr:flagellar basal body P-ring protein FlgI [Phycisphaerae bacterium]
MALLRTCVLLVAIALAAAGAPASQVQDLVRIKGRGESVLRGMGLVVGLPGTGDSGKELVVARPLAKVLENEGNAVGVLKELERGKSVALVLVTATIPEDGRVTDDRVDVSVSVVNSASSLKGGRLYLAPLRGPLPGSPVFAFAEGAVELDDPTTPTVGRVRGGARLIRDVTMPEVGDSFDLVLNPSFRSWSAAQQIAMSINSDAQAFGAPVATPVNEFTVRVTIPEAERPDRGAFIADVLSAPVNTSLIDLPAQVVVNSRTGAIVVTGDVTISPGLITHKDLTITTVVPDRVPTPQEPRIDRSRWAGMQAGVPDGGRAPIADLLTAFKQLDIEPREQINILQMLGKAGRLNARLVLD